MTEINVFYFHQPRPDDFHASSLLLLDGRRVWHVGRKGNGYYLFIDTEKYIKIWRDKGNLLFQIGDVTKPILAKELEVFEIDIALNYLPFSDDAIYIGGKYFKFTFPIIGFCRRLNQRATRPLVYLLYQLLTEQASLAHEETSAQAEAQEVQQKEVTEDGYS